MNNILRKSAFSLLALPGVVLIVFLLFRAFGDPASMMAGQSGDAKTLENIRRDLYLDKSPVQQFLFYLNDVSPLAVHTRPEIERKKLEGIFIGGKTAFAIKIPYLGTSYQRKKPVSEVLTDALPATIVLAFAALLFATIFGILFGTIAAVNNGRALDGIFSSISVIGISAPSFFMAILIAWLFGFVWHTYTGLPLTGSLFATDEITGERYIVLKNLVLPALTLGIRPLAMISQLTRASMIDVLNNDLVRTARAKGLPELKILWRHALPNAFNPVLTAITGWFGELLAGAFFVEYIFGWNGIGKVTVDALEKSDYPVVSGAVLLSAVIFIFVNIIADLLYAVMDPRLRT